MAQTSGTGGELESELGYSLPSETVDGAARLAALACRQPGGGTPTSLVAYQSSGHVLVVGSGVPAREAALTLAGQMSCTLLVAGPASAQSDAAGLATDVPYRLIHADRPAVRGHLGAFTVRVTVEGEERDLAPSLLTGHKPFDLVLDLRDRPDLAAEVPPPGYFAPRDDDALEAALQEIPDLVGEFEKPRYFAYSPDICAHGRSGLSGCTRCLDACPTDAITSAGDGIEVDPFLCQGGGSCATACPTGAITYAYPPVADLLGDLRRALIAFREAGGGTPVVLVHDAEWGRGRLRDEIAALPECSLPWEVEEVGSVGLDAWLALLAWGARGVVILPPPRLPNAVQAELRHQLEVASTILGGLGYPAGLVGLAPVDEGDLAERVSTLASAPPALEPARFAAVGEKRTDLRLAIDHLYTHAPDPVPVLDLPPGSPFGTVEVDREACTLCMACASVCPASAVIAGGELPRLDFVEQNCVQCGLCAAACPESCITPRPRLLFGAEARAGRRILNEESPFQCVSCGKPFATRSMIERMREKLAGHWMYRDNPDQMRRMEMCEECRVKDMFADGGGLLDVQEKPPTQ